MPRPESPETELHKLIRYGLDFEVERQMREVAGLRHENKALRVHARRKRKATNKRRARKRRRSGG